MEDITLGGFQNMLNEYCKSKTNGGCNRRCDHCIFDPDINSMYEDCNDFVISDLPRAAYMLYQAKNKKTDKGPVCLESKRFNVVDAIKDISAVEYFKILDEMMDADFIDEEIVCDKDTTENMITYVIQQYEAFKVPKELTFFDKFIDDNHIIDQASIVAIKWMCNDGCICRDKVFDINQDEDWECDCSCNNCKDCWNEKYNEDMHKMYD